MSTNDPPIPGFTRHGNRFRIQVTLAREDAQDVATEAEQRDVPPAAVVRERVRKGRRDGGAA